MMPLILAPASGDQSLPSTVPIDPVLALGKVQLVTSVEAAPGDVAVTGFQIVASIVPVLTV